LLSTLPFLILVAGLLYFLVWREAGSVAMQWASRPLLWVVSKVHFQSFTHSFQSKKVLLVENNHLKKEKSDLEQKMIFIEEIKKENERLKRLLDFKEELTFKTIPAKVVGRDPTRWYRGVLIDKGSEDGIELNMVVVNSDGLVGQVLEVSPNLSKVQLIVDLSSRVGAILQNSREAGILKGEGRGRTRLDYLSRLQHLKEGEKVLTSGMGSIYPKGILIGTTSRINKIRGGLYQSAYVISSVDFTKLEEVLILSAEIKK